jgi:hypothetical protein
MKKEYVVVVGMVLLFVVIIAYIAIAGAGINPI